MSDPLANPLVALLYLLVSHGKWGWALNMAVLYVGLLLGQFAHFVLAQELATMFRHYSLLLS